MEFAAAVMVSGFRQGLNKFMEAESPLALGCDGYRKPSDSEAHNLNVRDGDQESGLMPCPLGLLRGLVGKQTAGVDRQALCADAAERETSISLGFTGRLKGMAGWAKMWDGSLVRLSHESFVGP